MKHLFLTAAGLLAAGTSFAQGVHFETGNWAAVVAKAKKEHKLIYMDVYTTWCGPCKILEKQVFPQKAAGDKYNKLFVNYRVDAEKGEGIRLAKQYNVTGYPTNLYIDPANEAVVYTTSGTSGEVDGFNKQADIAMQELQDPMTWDKYTARYKTGKKDKAFLKAYLNKAERLDKPNDAILSDYVAILKAAPADDSEVLFVSAHMSTTDNDGLAYLADHKEVINRTSKFYPDYFDKLLDRWSYGTFEKAVKERNPALLDLISKQAAQYRANRDEATEYWYRTQYYTRAGDEAGALKAGAAEADYLAAKTDDYFNKRNEQELAEARMAVRQQLQLMKVPDDKLDELVDKNIAANKSMSHAASAQTADKLNSICWNTYEHHRGNKELVERALRWSARSLVLADGLDEWPSYADTYAHLLYASGDKAAAVKTQQEAVNKAKAAGQQDTAALEETLKHMQEGTL